MDITKSVSAVRPLYTVFFCLLGLALVLGLLFSPAVQATERYYGSTIIVQGHRYADQPSAGTSWAIGPYAAQTNSDKSAASSFGRGGRAGSPTQQGQIERCIAVADKTLADCKFLIIEGYIKSLQACDRVFPRRFRGYSLLLPGLFSLEYADGNRMCREDKVEVRDMNLAICDKWHAEDTYECKTS